LATAKLWKRTIRQCLERTSENDECGMMNDELKTKFFLFIIHHPHFAFKTYG